MIYPLKISLTFLTSLIVTLFILPRLSNIASKIGLMDYPDNSRKVHSTPKPLIGGLGMIIGISFSCLLFFPVSELRGFFAGVITLGIVGFLDDFRELHHRLKFVAQILASAFMIFFSKTVLLSFGDILSFGPINLGIFTIPMTIFCTVGVINAINMIDGLDGLAGGVSLTGFVAFAILAYLNHQTELVLLSLASGGAVAGFLRYNWHPSRLFMGDSGSLFLGFSLAFLSIAITQTNDSCVPPAAPLLILAVPIVDTITIMIKRILNGKNPFVADKYHFHHIFLRFGLDKKATLTVILFLSAILSSTAIIGTILKVPECYLFFIFIGYFVLYFTSSFYIKEMLKFKLQFRKNSSSKNQQSNLKQKG